MNAKRINISAEKVLGQRVRALRLQLGMSQDALAKELGVSFQQVQKYEKGVNRVTVSRMLEMCEHLQCSPNDIIGWKTGTPAINRFNTTVFEAAREFAEFPEDLQIAVRRICSVLVTATKKKR
jgi:transcriptional regulator with XRE-family HTH domain